MLISNDYSKNYDILRKFILILSKFSLNLKFLIVSNVKLAKITVNYRNLP